MEHYNQEFLVKSKNLYRSPLEGLRNLLTETKPFWRDTAREKRYIIMDFIND